MPLEKMLWVVLDVAVLVFGGLWFWFLIPDLGKRIAELQDPDGRERNAAAVILILSVCIGCWMLLKIWSYFLAPFF